MTTPPAQLTNEEREAAERFVRVPYGDEDRPLPTELFLAVDVLLARSNALDAAEAETTQTVAAMDELQNDYMEADTKIKELLKERDALAEQVRRLVNGVEMLLGAEDEIQRAEAEAVLREAARDSTPGESQEPSSDADKPDEVAPMTPAGSPTGPKKEGR